MDTEYGTINGWDYARKEKSYFFTRELTLAGATISAELPLGKKPMQLNRASMFFNSTNARTFTIRVHSKNNPASYDTLDAAVAHTTDSRILQLGAEYKYRAHKIAFNFSAFTAADIVSLEVQADEL